MENGNEVVKVEDGQALASPSIRTNASSIMFHPEVFAAVEKMADTMASARCMIPAHLIGKPADCFAVIMQAMQWHMNPFAVAQKTHLVSGTLGYEAQLVNAVVVNSGAISGIFQYEFYGQWEKVVGKFITKSGSSGKPYQAPGWNSEDEKGCGVKVSAVIKETGNTEVLELLLSQASVRNSTLWASDPKQQLAYLAVKRWARLYTPGAILGVYTQDELEEIPAKEPEKNVTPRFQMPKGNVPESKAPAFDVKADEAEAFSVKIKEMLAVFSNEFAVSQEMIESHFEQRADDFTEFEMAALRKIYRELKNNTASVEDYFTTPKSTIENTPAKTFDEYFSDKPITAAEMREYIKFKNDPKINEETTRNIDAINHCMDWIDARNNK